MNRFMTLIFSLLIVIILVWVGVSIYDASNDIEVNPNAEQFRAPIRPTFDMEVVDLIKDRISALPLSPKVFHALDQEYGGVDAPQIPAEEDTTPSETE